MTCTSRYPLARSLAIYFGTQSLSEPPQRGVLEDHSKMSHTPQLSGFHEGLSGLTQPRLAPPRLDAELILKTF
jgi:hypothetical protein